MARGLLDRVDRLVGEGIETTVRAHHRRRLRRLGQLARLDPPRDGRLWAGGSPPPRAGCSLEVLVDGAQALPRIHEAICNAQSHVHIAGWHVTPGFSLARDGDRDDEARCAAQLRELLGELAERVDVRVLLWAGAPLPVFPPSRSAMRAVRDELVAGTRVRCALDARERPLHCHHEKLVVVDDEVAFVGGIDLTSLAGDRYDSSDHPARGRLGWHDVSTCLRGPAVADVAAHFAMRWREVAGEELAVAPPAVRPRVAGGATPAATDDPFAGDVEIQLVRTVPERVYEALPRGDFRILESYVRALRSARSLVYLENQFLWSPEIVEILAGKLREPPSEEFRLVVLLPAKPNNGADDTRGQLGLLADADDGRHRFLAATIRSRTGSRSDALYVHAKVGIVDDTWLTIGSANLNEHSLFNDSEMNVVTCDPALARATRLRLWAEHLERPIDELAGPPGRAAQVVDELWRPIAAEQLARRRRGEPPTHRLLELPGISRRSRAIMGPLQGFLVDG